MHAEFESGQNRFGIGVAIAIVTCFYENAHSLVRLCIPNLNLTSCITKIPQVIN